MSTIDPRELAHFKQFANDWWDYYGVYRILHQLNPLRLQFVIQEIQQHFMMRCSKDYLSQLWILDVGCGGGLLTVPLARLGAQVCGIDASSENIIVAKKHVAKMQLPNLEYLTTTAEEYARENQVAFDVIVGFEILEHVANPQELASAMVKLLKKDGLLLLSTINRNLKAYLLAILLAEKVLKWVPVNTHNYQKLLRPAEVDALFTADGFSAVSLRGLNFDMWERKWVINRDIKVNYMMSLARKKSKGNQS